MFANYVKALTSRVLIAGLLAGPLLAAATAERQKLEEIQSTVEQFALAQLDKAAYAEVSVGASKLDPRLNLQQCDQPLQAFTTNSGIRAGRTTVGVRCEGTVPWTLYVPVQINATVSVVTLRSALARGAVVTQQDLALSNKPFATLPVVYLTDLQDALGKELTRNLSADTVLAPAMLKVQPVVTKGQEVVITASSSGFEVKMAGTAMQNGARGERIAVKNNNSGRTIQAVIVDNHTVQVQF
jgi:flagella basal body P-ring formation protein FlgA